MYIEKIEASYFLGFGEYSKIEFDKETVIGIVGTYEKSKEQSNRAGKSSFLEIILYNLYGKCRAKTEKDAINWNYENVDMYTRNTYNFNGRRVVITRGRTAGNDLILEVDGLEGGKKKDVQSVINELVGMSYDDFVKLNFFMQDDIHTFINSGSTEMSRMLSKWIKVDYWEDYRKQSEMCIKSLDKERIEIESFIEMNKDVTLNSIRIDSKAKGEIETGILSLKEQQAVLIEKQAKIDDVQDMKKEVSKKKARILNYESKIQKFDSKIEKIKEKISEIEENKKTVKVLQKKLKREASKEVRRELRDQIKEHYSESKVLKKELNNCIDKMEEMKEGVVCPVTETKCDFLKGKAGQKIIDELNEKMFELEHSQMWHEGEMEILEKKLSKFEKVIESNSEIQEQINNLDVDDSEYLEDLETLKEEKEEIIQDIKELKADILKLNKKVSKLDSGEDYTAEIEELELMITVETKKVGEYVRKIKEGNGILAKVKKYRKRLVEISTEIKQLKFISFMFSKRGIPGNQIEGAFAEVESDANYILKSKLNTDIQIEFKNYKELQEKEPICQACGFIYPKNYRKKECESCGTLRGKKKKDELNLKLFVGGKETTFETDSGAGKVMTSLAIRIALARMLSRRAGVKCSMLFLDEIFASLDAVNRRKTMQLVLDVLVNDFGFTQIFCISHNEDISKMLQKNIQITKFDKFSNFEWED